MSKIWVEKYRPQNFGEIKGQDKIVDRIKGFVEKKNLFQKLFKNKSYKKEETEIKEGDEVNIVPAIAGG